MKKVFACLLIICCTVIVVLNACNKEVTIFFVGDILLDRGVGEKIDKNGPDYPYKNIKDILPKADIAFGNLECPITSTGIPALKRPYYLFKGEPYNAEALKKSGFNILNLANNHTMDYSREGILNTIKSLENNGIKTVGAGEDKTSAHKPLFTEVSGTVTGFLSFLSFPVEGYIYSDKKPDVARLDLATLADEVKSAKTGCDFLVVSFHWGSEFSNYPTESQKKAAHISIENGADLVIGHHPHVLQGMEFYKDKPIFYSLGNFVFDKQDPVGTDETVKLKVKLRHKAINNLEISPIKIIECQPTKPNTNEDALNILNNFEKFSNSINPSIRIDKESTSCSGNAVFYPICKAK